MSLVSLLSKVTIPKKELLTKITMTNGDRGNVRLSRQNLSDLNLQPQKRVASTSRWDYFVNIYRNEFIYSLFLTVNGRRTSNRQL